ncbi:hypothetical protein F4859DRAFT_201021 [Xylaria cf. heliscus]|nr:hypothetical protein F4859DRAFT_201021 [Xylaria cf. heliscus]
MEDYSQQSRHLTFYLTMNTRLQVKDPRTCPSYIALRVTFHTYHECTYSQPVTAADEGHIGIVPLYALQLEKRPEWYPPRSPWNQEPSDELDAVWMDLLHALNVRITNDEMDLLHENKSNRVQVTGGNRQSDRHEYDYVGVLGVYHHLHCLNNLRRRIHWDYYGPRMAGLKHLEGLSKEHSDHCIDTIRQALMCHANTGVYTSEWNYETHNPSRNLESRSPSTCVRWDSLNDWARDRALVPGQYHYIRGPYDPDRPDA